MSTWCMPGSLRGWPWRQEWPKIPLIAFCLSRSSSWAGEILLAAEDTKWSSKVKSSEFAMVAAWNRNKNQTKNMSWSGKRQHRAFTGELWKSKAKEITSGKPREIQITKTSQSELEEAEETPVTGARSRKLVPSAGIACNPSYDLFVSAAFFSWLFFSNPPPPLLQNRITLSNFNSLLWLINSDSRKFVLPVSCLP